MEQLEKLRKALKENHEYLETQLDIMDVNDPEYINLFLQLMYAKGKRDLIESLTFTKTPTDACTTDTQISH